MVTLPGGPLAARRLRARPRTFAGHTTLELKREVVFKLTKPNRQRR